MLDTSAAVTLDKDGDAFTITRLALILKARVAGISSAELQSAATDAKANCPMSKLLKAEIFLNASLVS